MINQRIEMKLPDDTTLIAEANQKSDYPSINIYHKDVTDDVDEVAFAEYNPENEIGRKLVVGAYQNNDDETRYYKSFHYVFKPTFKELYQLYKDSEESEYKLVQDDDFYEIIRENDGLVIYRDFSYDNDILKSHIGHSIKLAAYGAMSGIQNVSIECEDCNEVIYSVERKTPLSEIFRVIKPRSLFDISDFAQDTDKLAEYGCIGFSKIDFGPDGKGFNTKWTDKTELLRNVSFAAVYNELVNDFLSYNMLADPESMKDYCKVCEELLSIWDGMFATQVVTQKYTFFVILAPNGNKSEAYIYAYANEILFKHIEAFSVPADSNIDCEAKIRYGKGQPLYKNPGKTYLDYAEEECWKLFKEYAKMIGVEFGDGIDFTIAKEVSEKIISLVERTFGVDFPMHKGGN